MCPRNSLAALPWFHEALPRLDSPPTTAYPRPIMYKHRVIDEPGRRLLRMTVNDSAIEIAVRPHKTLLEVLREDLFLTGTKHGCELGECGTCAILVDGEPVLSCLVLAIACEGKEIRTIEGMADGPELHPLQTTFADLGAAQCGYCTPGFLLTAQALLDENPDPTRQEIKNALAGNLCRCTGYLKIYEAVELAAKRMRNGSDSEAKR